MGGRRVCHMLYDVCRVVFVVWVVLFVDGCLPFYVCAVVCVGV